MISYTTTIESLKYHKVDGDLQNVVRTISVCKAGVHPNGYRFEFRDKLNFSTPDGEQFTPYEDLTQEMLLEWIDSHPSNFNEKAEQYIAASIQQQVDSNEVETTKLPYNTIPSNL